MISITPDVLEHRDELSKFIGDEIAKTMVEQRALEKRYEQVKNHSSTFFLFLLLCLFMKTFLIFHPQTTHSSSKKEPR
jgi:hypothetical protein